MKTESNGYFDQIYNSILIPEFQKIEDARKENQSYPLEDCLKSGYAIYSLKSPSLLSFNKRSVAEESNIQSVYKINKIPSDNGLRKILDEVKPKELRPIYHQLYNYLKGKKILDGYKYWNDYLIVSFDAVEYFTSKEICCDKCMQRKHRDGSVSNYHKMLSSAIVHPEKKEVFILDNEPILRQDGETKNDCEINAYKRFIQHVKSLYSNELMVMVFDALYACGPVIKTLEGNENWKYVISLKEDGNKHIFKQFDQKNNSEKVNWYSLKKDGIKHTFGYINNIELNESNPDIKVNVLYYIEKDKKGKEQIFSWISNIKISKKNAYKIMRIGRSRWKIENETFNTLKNQGYHYSHNFGHGENNLSVIFAYLMMAAFYIDQIQQAVCHYFKTILKSLGTRSKLWESMRAVFKILPSKNMTKVLINVAEMYQIRLF